MAIREAMGLSRWQPHIISIYLLPPKYDCVLAPGVFLEMSQGTHAPYTHTIAWAHNIVTQTSAGRSMTAVSLLFFSCYKSPFIIRLLHFIGPVSSLVLPIADNFLLSALVHHIVVDIVFANVSIAQGYSSGLLCLRVLLVTVCCSIILALP